MKLHVEYFTISVTTKSLFPHFHTFMSKPSETEPESKRTTPFNRRKARSGKPSAREPCTNRHFPELLRWWNSAPTEIGAFRKSCRAQAVITHARLSFLRKIEWNATSSPKTHNEGSLAMFSIVHYGARGTPRCENPRGFIAASRLCVAFFVVIEGLAKNPSVDGSLFAV